MELRKRDPEMQCQRGNVVCHALNFIKKMKFCTYCRRKSYAQMSMDVALVITNAAHLVRILRGHPDEEMRLAKIVLVSVSIALEVLIGILLVLKERYDIDDEKCHKIMDVMNDIVIFLIFTSVLVHVFVSVFVEDHMSPHQFALHYKHFSNCSASSP
ncbi:ninjurin-1-like [Argiope bruennichi]|uniref:ninjurin-1-like n=1 Tax=Argiope bruennichi TaxID=94029 RepID=UPI00249429AD|nr:ninjurin-1-like [Argiope bruennichi]